MDARSRFLFFHAIAMRHGEAGRARAEALLVTARGCTREGWEEDERSSLVARVPLVFPVVRHGAVRGDARRRPARGLLARIDVLRHHRCALPRVRGRAERAGGHAEPARGHALVHEPEELPGGVQRRRGGGILRPQRHAGRGPRRDASRQRRARWRRLRDVRGGGGRARRRGRGGRRGGPGRGRGERPTGPAHGGRTHGRATSAAPDARPSVPSARGVPRRECLFSGPKVAPDVEGSRRARFSPRAPRAFLPPRDFRPCLAFRAPCAASWLSGARARAARREARNQRIAPHQKRTKTKTSGPHEPRINRRTSRRGSVFPRRRARDRGG